jgi:hypothetical protein
MFYSAQLEAIREYIDLDKLKPRAINTFDQGGAFRRSAEIAAELISG